MGSSRRAHKLPSKFRRWQKWMTDNDKKAGNKFFYQNKKQKANPWNSFDKDPQEDSRTTFNKRPLGSSTVNGATSDLNSLPLKSKFDLDSVWSVRKNVPLGSNSKQTNQLNLQTGNSYYSRHAGGLIGSHHSKSERTANESSNSTWQAKKPGYSFTNQGSLKRQADDDEDEFDFEDSKKKGNFSSDESPSYQLVQASEQKSTITNKGALASVINPTRKGSARTQRAQKMHDAYLRSAGLGCYAATDPFHSNNEDNID